MLDATSHATLMAQPAPALPVERLVLGRKVDEVASLLPSLFNLCRAAQSAAVQAARGQRVDLAGISTEILRDHLLKFHVTWPAFFGLPPSLLPDDWAACGAGLRQAVFGPSGAAPTTAAAFHHFLQGDQGYAPILRRIERCFAPGEGAAEGFAPVSPATIWDVGSVDNSVAARVAHIPAMADIAVTHGRGPLWRAAARIFDIAAVLDGNLPELTSPRPGEAVVSATRGSYGVRLDMRDGVVTDFKRVTPTDHLLAEGGVLDRALATLPADKAGLGPLLLDILDPCSPVRLREVAHA